MPLNKDALAIVAKLNKKLGAGTVVIGKDIRKDLMSSLPTGSLALDVAMGGGWPRGQWSEIVGDESAGKTAVVLKTIACNQQLDPEFTAVWVAAEGWVPQYAEMCGVDTSRVIVVEENGMEAAYEAVVTLAESRAIDFIAIDSLPALIPQREADGEVGDTQPGRAAFVTNQFFRIVGKAMKRNLTEFERPVTGILINQWREKIGVMHGDPRTTGGGKGKNFACFLRLDVRRQEWQEIGPSGAKVRIGQTIAARTIKNKTFPQQRVAHFDFYFDDGGPVAPGEYDFGKEVTAIASVREVIERRGGYYYFTQGDKQRQWQGLPAVVESVREEPDLRKSIEDEVMSLISIERKARQ